MLAGACPGFDRDIERAGCGLRSRSLSACKSSAVTARSPEELRSSAQQSPFEVLGGSSSTFG